MLSHIFWLSVTQTLLVRSEFIYVFVFHFLNIFWKNILDFFYFELHENIPELYM